MSDPGKVVQLIARRDAHASERRRLLAELASIPPEEVDKIMRALGYVRRSTDSGDGGR
jgi:hypothetical protein